MEPSSCAVRQHKVLQWTAGCSRGIAGSDSCRNCEWVEAKVAGNIIMSGSCRCQFSCCCGK
eukprot:643636-Amphidinium_carterae.1